MVALRCFAVLFLLAAASPLLADDRSSFTFEGVLLDDSGAAIVGATLRLASQDAKKESTTATGGAFRLTSMPPGEYTLAVGWNGKWSTYPHALHLPGASDALQLTISASGLLSIRPVSAQKTGGEQLSS